MKGRRGLALVLWLVTFGLVTWWVATEGEAPIGPAAAVGAVVATVLAVPVARAGK